MLPLLYREFKKRHLNKCTNRAEAFLAFVEQGGESLLHQVAFDALHAALQSENQQIWGWPAFSQDLQHFDSKVVENFIAANIDQVHMYMYLQWVADIQIQEAQALAQEKGMSIGLYRDLAVGVAGAGAETWADNGNLVMDVSIGAPPDVLGPLGQNWGLPPLTHRLCKLLAMMLTLSFYKLT